MYGSVDKYLFICVLFELTYIYLFVYSLS